MWRGAWHVGSSIAGSCHRSLRGLGLRPLQATARERASRDCAPNPRRQATLSCLRLTERGGEETGCSRGAQLPVFQGENQGPGWAVTHHLRKPYLAQGEQGGDGPEGELQHHQGGHARPQDGQDQGQPGQVHRLQQGPLGLQPLLLQPPLGAAVGQSGCGQAQAAAVPPETRSGEGGLFPPVLPTPA